MENFNIGDKVIYIPNSINGEPLIILDCHIGRVINKDDYYIHVHFDCSEINSFDRILPAGLKHYPLLDEVKREIYIRI